MTVCHKNPKEQLKCTEIELFLNATEYNKNGLLEQLKKICKLTRGYLLALLAAFLLSIRNVLMKKSSLISSFEQLTIYYAIAAIITPLLIVQNNLGFSCEKSERFLLTIRSLFGVFGLLSLYFSLILIAPSDCLSISNSSIIITAIIARLVLKEKLGIAHILAVVFTVSGILFISKPSFIFGSKYGQNANESQLSFVLGISMAIVASIFLGLLRVVMKIMCNSNIHWYKNKTTNHITHL